MKKHTIGYKEQIKEMGRESDSIITFGETVLGSEELNAVTPSFQSGLLKSAMKQLDVDSNVEIPAGTILNYKFGTKVNGEYEYIDYGNYVVKDVEKQEDTLSYKITCYDKMLYSMKDYVGFVAEYPLNVREYINLLCEYLGLKFANVNDEFVNYDKIIPNELYLDENGNSLGYTFRDVFDELAQVTASTICINDNDEVEVRYIKDAINSSVKKGSNIETNDSMDYPVLNYKQYGYTKQNVYSGKNLFDISKVPNTSTITNQGETLLISKTYYNHSGKKLSELAPNLEVGKTYFLNLETSNGGNQFIYLVGTNVSWLKGLTRTITQTDLDSYVAFYGTVDVDVIISKIQIEPGDTFTGYEPYVGGKASPSPDYPQEIEVATGSVSAKSTGKNLFNEEYALKTQWITNGSVLTTNAYIKSNDKILISKGYGKWGRYFFNKMKLSEGKYVLRFNLSVLEAVESFACSVRDFDNAIDIVPLKGVTTIPSEYTVTFELTKPTTIGVSIQPSTETELYISNIQLEKGEVATDYQEFQESSITYDLGDNFLADKDYIENDVLNKNIGKVVLNGSENWGLWSTNVFYIPKLTDKRNLSSTHFAFVTTPGASQLKDGEFCITAEANNYSVLFKNTEFNTVADFKAWLGENNVEVYYELPTPEQIQLETTGELITFEPNTIITNDLDTEMEVEYGNSFDTIDEEYFKDINVNFGEKYGPINSVVLSRASESDNIYLRDEESIETNGLCELKIKENQIMNFNNRDEFLQGIFEKLNGIEYHLNDFASTGITYYDICDRYKVMIDDKTYSCVMFNDEILVTQGLEENVFTEMPEESETDYTKADKTDRKINQTYIIANKQKGEIESLTSQVRIINNELDNVYTIEQTNRLIQNAETGVTNTFSEAGGNNVFRNTGLWFANSGEDDETNPYEFWKGKANQGTNDKATNYRSIKLVKGSFIQDAEVPNGKYSISFYYRKLISNAIVSVVINDKEYELDSTDIKQFFTGEQDSESGEYIVDPIEVTNNHIKIEFKCDALDGVEVYDLMCNKGSVKLAYSQNQNETTTDTVNISKGITITSSVDENTKFKADYDGIRVLDKNNSVKTKFTDKGTETDELVVRKKATITGLLQQEVDDQTWVTKI